MNKKISLGSAIAFMAIVAAVTFSLTMVHAMRRFNDTVYSIKERESMYSKIAEIDSVVRQNYLRQIGTSRLMDATAAGFLAGINDPYAEYYDAEEYAEMLQDLGGKSVQIGIVTEMDESGYIKVTDVYPGSPAQAAGIEPGNLIVRVDEVDVTKDNYVQAVAMLRGEAGTKMNITLREGTNETQLEMTRRFVEIPSVSATMLDSSIGLIRFKEFNDYTPEQFGKQVEKLIGEGAQGMIFDVRGVRNGTLRSVTQVLDRILPEGVLVSSSDKDDNVTVLESSDMLEINLPMAVLVNDKTAGESELFALVIRDFNKGKIVGVKTAGRGTVQTTFPLSDGSAVKLTTARYLTASGVSFDQEGVKPDFEVKLTEEQAALVAAGEIDSDAQLKKAIEATMVGIKAAENAMQEQNAAATAAQ